ncbi:MAG: hypothetical protein ACI9DF_002518, partial [Verrucomicrobiales bacterium]
DALARGAFGIAIGFDELEQRSTFDSLGSEIDN